MRKKWIVPVLLILSIVFLLGGCSGPVNPAFHVFADGQRWTAEEMDIFFDIHSIYYDYENGQSRMAGYIHTENGDVFFFASPDTSAQLYFFSEERVDNSLAMGRFVKAPDDYTYVVRIDSSRIPDILPNGTVLTFRREDITNDELFLPEELGELKQIVGERSTAEEMDIFFDLHASYRDYENSNASMVGRIHAGGKTICFCADYGQDSGFDLHFYSLDSANTEFAIGRFVRGSHDYQVEIDCSQIPDILPDGTILTFKKEEIPVDALFMPEELGELRTEGWRFTDILSDFSFDCHSKYLDYENSISDKVGRICTESETIYFCAEYDRDSDYDLHFYSLDSENVELAIGHFSRNQFGSKSILVINSSKIPDILPNGTALYLKREDITEEELFLPEELGELKQEKAE